MSDVLAFITWDVDWNALESPIAVRYYGILWALSFLIGIFLMKKMMANDNAPEEYTDKIFLYVLIGGVVGARLGHVVFYDPQYYFTSEHWTEIPMIWKGGLASHGGAIGVLLANWLYSRRVSKRSFLWSVDKIVVAVALAGCLIRVGNLMNSEIIGRESESSTAMFFQFAAEEDIATDIYYKSGKNIEAVSVEITPQGEDYIVKMNVKANGTLTNEHLSSLLNAVKTEHREGSEGFNEYEDHIKTMDNPSLEVVQANGNTGYMQFSISPIPRIPTQIWEAGVYLLIFFFLFWGYWKQHWYRREGLLFGLFLVLVFGARFIIEFYKENQVEDLTDEVMLNMGQRLSIPAILIGIYCIYRAFANPQKDTKVHIEKTEE
ncbi:prolipoprotein diacylglyceryl transferase [Parvicella tangerina]|uniref:Phosphatidylglycerol--prolipoprotein diacylglyceryl transferase n=1 Tax=Parvicella tangerina TaxID=2829795 RepID=A0A916JIZ1_9FLAO|nr:prolipoprotein diacylglyceryl transferase [Parvicella tangerina]CAG5076757.1 Phosphatidylglycerol--prolipoprotein diacylglyceryl transferase [Parvicella tangerina]